MERKYSCDTLAETNEWIKAIVDFVTPYRFFFDTNVVDFLKDRHWEALDKDWIDCLVNEPVDHLFTIPSGVVQDHWPASLKDYVLTTKLLAFPREQAQLQKVFPSMSIISVNNVLSQGMNPKKRHEVEILSSLVSCITRNVGAEMVVDVGAGQGYLSQVLAFQYQLPVVAIDSSSHHGVVTKARAERNKKHYAAKLRDNGSVEGLPNIPETVTCRILSSGMLRELSNRSCQQDMCNERKHKGKRYSNISEANLEVDNMSLPCSGVNAGIRSSLVLAGLHACGDLSVTMLRAFAECEEVKAMVSVSCCYNLLSEDGCENDGPDVGFPVSKGVTFFGISLGKDARELACESAERWRDLEKEAGLQNFDLLAFRAAFQLVLDQYYPEVLLRSPSIGRQGKALRRQLEKGLPSCTEFAESKYFEFPASKTTTLISYQLSDDISKTVFEVGSSTEGSLCNFTDRRGRLVNKYSLFEKFSCSGLCHLGLEPLQDIDLRGIWREYQPFAGLLAPYWSLRAALGPVLETLVLLDRLLFLQEQECASEVLVLPIFDPVLSPRNMAIIAHKRSPQHKYGGHC